MVQNLLCSLTAPALLKRRKKNCKQACKTLALAAGTPDLLPPSGQPEQGEATLPRNAPAARNPRQSQQLLPTSVCCLWGWRCQVTCCSRAMGLSLLNAAGMRSEGEASASGREPFSAFCWGWLCCKMSF